MATTKSSAGGKGDLTYVAIYFVEIVTGVIFFLISEGDKRKRLHSLQAIALGITAIVLMWVLPWVLFFLWPILGLISLGIWLYGLWIGYQASMGTDVVIPVITDLVKPYV